MSMMKEQEAIRKLEEIKDRTCGECKGFEKCLALGLLAVFPIFAACLRFEET